MDFRPIKENSGNFLIFGKNYRIVGHFFIINCGLDESSPYNLIPVESDESSPYNLIPVESDESKPYNLQFTF
jgi:hypothetical protein